jgi:HD-GYP domain-containing protein (c-di-GMP phosphodiesterase class II)
MVKITEINKKLEPEKPVQLIFKYISKLEKEKNIDNVLIVLSEMARELIESDRCTLWMYNEEKNIFWTKIAHGLTETIEVPGDKGTIGLAKNENRAFIIQEPYKHASFNPDVDEKTGYETSNLMVVPIRNIHNEVIGVYQSINKKEGEFSEYDLNFLKLVAGYSSEIIESALLYQEIEDTQKEVIFRMGDIAEAKSRETGNHIKRVAEYTRILSKEYGLPGSEVELATLASPMHDIGKIAIPDGILHKPGRLTPEEFDVIKTHSTVGWNLLKFSKRKILKAASVIAYEHHEKWNGKGYPRGLAGEDIHIYGRILGIADVFDALISDRCYKKAWPLEKVVKLFEEERGQHFDPDLTDIFLNNVDQFVAIKDNYLDEFTYTS